MADNSSRLDASGVSETLASDDIAGVKYQRVKLAIGADGTAVDVQPPVNGMLGSAILASGGLTLDRGSGLWNSVSSSGRDGETPAQLLGTGNMLFNETLYDRQRGNTEVIAIALAARTTSTTSAALVNYNARGVIVSIRITVASGTGGLTVRITALVNSGTAAINLNAAPTAILATGTYSYELYPGSSTAGSAGAGLVQQRTAAALPRNFRLDVTHGDASSYTYEVGYQAIV